MRTGSNFPGCEASNLLLALIGRRYQEFMELRLHPSYTLT